MISIKFKLIDIYIHTHLPFHLGSIFNYKEGRNLAFETMIATSSNLFEREEKLIRLL